MTISGYSSATSRYYIDNTQGLYLSGWSRDHVHFGLFEPGECPAPGEVLADSAGLARALTRMIEVIVAPADIQKRHHVVDAGCGMGGTAIHLAKSRGCTVTGINLSNIQLEIAIQKAKAENVDDRVDFKYADCSVSLPFADESVDVVVNIESACHYSDRVRFLHEVSRILKPSGTLVVTDWMCRDGLSQSEYQKYIVPLCEPFAIVGLENQSAYSEKLRQAGLEILQFEGFNGKDADNLRILGNACNLLVMTQLLKGKTPGIGKLLGQLQPLYKAWKRGSFEIRRYCARKPG